jgi:hypothetical protein
MRARAVLSAGLVAAFAACETVPFMGAIERGSPAEVAAALDKGQDVNGRLGSAALTPLQIAARRGRVDVATLLLDRGADVNVRRNGTSALSLAAISGDVDMTRLLLLRGAEVRRREISWARGSRRAEITALLDAAAAKAAALASPDPALSTSTAPSASADVPNYRTSERPDDFAVVVAIGRPMEGPEVPFAREDAAAVRRHLVALGWPSRNIVTLTDEGAGRAAFTRYLERWLPNNAVENSRVVFYFAGAGTVDSSGRAILLPWDGDPAQPEATGYPVTRVYAMLNALHARAALVVVDAGFSGAGPRSVAPPKSPAPAARVDLGARDLGDCMALFAVKDSEPLALSVTEKHGSFTLSLLEGLNGAAKDAKGFVTLRGLYHFALSRSAGARTPPFLTGGLGEADLTLR